MKKLTIFLFFLLLSLNSINSRTFRVNQIPNGSEFGCKNCHTSASGGGSLNLFGKEIDKNYLSGGNVVWNSKLAKLDSDGDGISNGAELQDPDGTWKIGDANPGTLGKTTNPGDKTSFTGVLENLLSNNFIKINSIFPNPVNINSSLNITVIESGNLNISIFDSFGRLIDIIANDYYQAGIYAFKLNSNNLIGKISDGNYFIRVGLNNYFTIHKVIINK